MSSSLLFVVEHDYLACHGLVIDINYKRGAVVFASNSLIDTNIKRKKDEEK